MEIDYKGKKYRVIEFQNLTELREAVAANKFMTLNLTEPKKNCKLCFGRGSMGRNVHTNRVIPCRCVNARIVKGMEEITTLPKEEIKKSEQKEDIA